MLMLEVSPRFFGAWMLVLEVFARLVKSATAANTDHQRAAIELLTWTTALKSAEPVDPSCLHL